jgi:hypothetical protein
MMSGYLAGDVPISWKLLYVFGATAICFTCATLSHSKWYLYASTGSTAVLGYGLMMLGFRGAASLVGREAMTALSWSVATLLIGLRSREIVLATSQPTANGSLDSPRIFLSPSFNPLWHLWCAAVASDRLPPPIADVRWRAA